MPEKLVRLHESTVEKLQVMRLKIQELLDLNDLPSQNFTLFASLHLGMDILEKTNKAAPGGVVNNTRLIEWLSEYYQKWIQEHPYGSNGEEKTTELGQ